MKYIRNFQSFRKADKVNEEFIFGKILEFLKGLWNKVVTEFKKLGQDPTIEQIDNFLETKIFNPADPNYIFKSVIDEFKKKTETNTEDCISLVTNILDPVKGSLGAQGLQPLYDGLLKVYGKNLAPIEIIKYIIETARNRAIKDYKYGGGPDLKAGQKVEIKPELIKIDLNDITHLPDYKKELKSVGEDNVKRKEKALNWVQKVLTPRILKYIQEIKPEDVENYLKSKNIEVPTGVGELKVGDNVIYKRDEFDEEKWRTITDEDKKKPNEGKIKDLVTQGLIGNKIISKIEGTKISFQGANFTKEKSEILMKIEGGEQEAQIEISDNLKKIKSTKQENIPRIGNIIKKMADNEENIKKAQDALSEGGE